MGVAISVFFEHQYKDKWKQLEHENLPLFLQKKKVIPLVQRAIKKGILKRQPCVKCGKTKKIHGHHPDYSKPLKVIWLCVSCHKKEHARLNKLNKQ